MRDLLEGFQLALRLKVIEMESKIKEAYKNKPYYVGRNRYINIVGEEGYDTTDKCLADIISDIKLVRPEGLKDETILELVRTLNCEIIGYWYTNSIHGGSLLIKVHFNS